MNLFSDARFAQYKKNEDVSMNAPEVENIPIISVESREVTLILTTTVINGQLTEQYFSKDGQMVAQKKPTSSANEVS